MTLALLSSIKFVAMSREKILFNKKQVRQDEHLDNLWAVPMDKAVILILQEK